MLCQQVIIINIYVTNFNLSTIFKGRNIYLPENVTCSATAKPENPSALQFSHHDWVRFNCNTLGVLIRASAHAAMQKIVRIFNYYVL